MATKKRINLLLHARPASSLEWLLENTDAATQTAAIERALLFYKEVTALEQQGFELQAKNADGDVIKFLQLLS